MKTMKITRRTKSLGISWTNGLERVDDANGCSSGVADPGGPDVVGSPAAILKEFDRARRINSGGTFWRCNAFLGRTRLAYAKELIGTEIAQLVAGKDIDYVLAEPYTEPPF